MAEHDTMVVQLLAQIQGEMRSGFSGIHSRQDITNGRINKAEVAIAQLQERTANIMGTDRGASDDQRQDRLPLRHDRRIWVGTGIGTAVTAFVWALVKVLEALAQHASQGSTMLK